LKKKFNTKKKKKKKKKKWKKVCRNGLALANLPGKYWRVDLQTTVISVFIAELLEFFRLKACSTWTGIKSDSPITSASKGKAWHLSGETEGSTDKYERMSQETKN
jgi:hypothetical protein